MVPVVHVPHEENPGTPERWNEYFGLLGDRLEERAPDEILASQRKAVWAEQLLGKKAQPRTVNQIYYTAA